MTMTFDRFANMAEVTSALAAYLATTHDDAADASASVGLRS
ncbi:hypothetical protein W911_04405 [Hyphomicrobium nitrativorans NL23]|uniref:Uncharacterized protein n=1 Tax=Hyphomicrobium nitrativorans NL23 TaxID=1029756 RepID=V5SHF5_9HYPH|nr:hypothetical protein W911_04405 [Hyphomicrobium nitrativorans NL23]